VKSRTTSKFRKAFEKIPKQIQTHARRAFEQFAEDPEHPSLHFKQVHPTKPIYSARVSLNYRVLGVKDADAIVWFWIGSHDDYDRLLSRM